MTEDPTDVPVQMLSRREVLGTGAAVTAGAIGMSGNVAAQSGGPSDEISGIVEDSSGPVDGATVVAVPHDETLDPLVTQTASDGTYIFEQSDLHDGENLYHVIARDGTETDPRRGVQNYPFIAAEGPAAIPESEADGKLVHRYVLDSVGDGTAEDSIGTADGTVSGVSSVTGNWAGGAAGQGDGTDDYITTDTFGSYGSNMSGDFAVAFSVQGTWSNESRQGPVNNSGSTFAYFPQYMSGGEIAFWLRDEDTENIQVTTSGTYNDGNPYRVVLNKTANSASGLEIWVNQSQVTVSQDRDEPFDNPANFDVDVPLFARNLRGSFDQFFAGIQDDVCFFDDSLTQTEIQSYNNPWS